MSSSTTQQVHIPSPCWARHPDGIRHCTRPPQHTDVHYHWPTRTSWPNSGNDPQ